MRLDNDNNNILRKHASFTSRHFFRFLFGALHRSSMQEYFEQNAVCNVQCLKVSQKQTRVALLLDSLVDKLRHMKSKSRVPLHTENYGGSLDPRLATSFCIRE